ncbi:peptide-methionine (S)-S-oxide reductase MsrA [Rheinheimera salexigens]|uniref:Peptide methionine sulfoxide reductase MsrA n=1 Tax=Rheinheimera salexigens TaxID=1628148 RepID=A0A1E7Q548_9GAMM|nr:peptide-methionine (S)-S-oxide reductase MsrA [Rheinheimera salexigens]OEY69324.1 peptide-methionine (S)-S-oxide reductase [Rheinheimera salexigens]
MSLQTATFGAGCFWCLDAAMNQLNGVKQALSGYMGGPANLAHYQAVCSGQSGHAEVVQVVFDPSIVSYEQLCLVFFSLHDPTQLNRQGHDIGTQYRSVIFYHCPSQLALAEKLIKNLTEQAVFNKTIVTALTPASEFFAAEKQHQNYFQQHPEQGYCQVIIAPKMAKFRQQYSELLKS